MAAVLPRLSLLGSSICAWSPARGAGAVALLVCFARTQGRWFDLPYAGLDGACAGLLASLSHCLPFTVQGLMGGLCSRHCYHAIADNERRQGQGLVARTFCSQHKYHPLVPEPAHEVALVQRRTAAALCFAVSTLVYSVNCLTGCVRAVELPRAWVSRSSWHIHKSCSM